MCDDTPLYLAVLDQDLAEVERLVRLDPTQVNVGSEEQWTPLHAAAYDGQRAMCEVLIKYGADLNSRDCAGRTPLHHAAFQGRPETAEILLEHGAEMEVKDDKGWTPLYCSTKADAGCRAVAELLLQRGARLDLSSAICLGRYDHVRKALQESDQAIKDALFPDELVVQAVGNNCQRDKAAEMVSLLLEHGAKVNSVDYANESALSIACADKLLPIEVIRILLDHGADPTLRRNQDGATAFEMAQSVKNDRAVQLLRSYGINE